MTRQGATSGPSRLPASTSAALAAGLGPLRHVVSTGSTNTDLVREAREGDTGPGVLVSDHQTAGRGRLDRSWEDRPGRSLLVSLRVRVPAAGAQTAMNAVAAGARDALAQLVPVPVGVKWPNDLVVTEGPRPGKLAGVLAEFVDGAEPVVVVGLGCNIGPIDSQSQSTSVDACGGTADRDDVLAAVLEAVGHRLARPDQVLDELRTHSSTLGTRVRVERLGVPPLVGTATELHGDGRLVVVDAGGEPHVIGTADVVRARPSD